MPSLVEKLLHQLASKQTIIVNVYDTTSQQAPIKMYGADVADAGMLHISPLDFGDPTRKHEMHCRLGSCISSKGLTKKQLVFPVISCILMCRFKQKPPPPWPAITASVGVLVITLLLGHIFHAAINQIAKVEHDYREMMELKHRAEAADVAKSEVNVMQQNPAICGFSNLFKHIKSVLCICVLCLYIVDNPSLNILGLLLLIL